MLLSDISLIEATIVDVVFNQNLQFPGDGGLHVEYGELDFEAGAILSHDATKASIIVIANPKMQGFSNDNGNVIFSLNIKMRMLYSYSREHEVNEKFINENTWYFTALMKMHFKKYAEDLLNNTTLKGIDLPLQ